MRSSAVHVKQTPYGDVLTTENGAPLFGVRTDRFSGLIMPDDTAHRLKPDPVVEGEVYSPNPGIPLQMHGVELGVLIQAGVPYEVMVQMQYQPPPFDPDATERDFVVISFPQVWPYEIYVDPVTGILPDELGGRPLFNKPFSAPSFSTESGPYVLETAQLISDVEMVLQAAMDTYHYDQIANAYTKAENPVKIIRSAMSVREIIL